ncbi:MAG: HDOD domain-containing protein [Burkholderiaceae bacterium]
MERGFETGATAIVGWPFKDAMERADKPASNPSFATVAKLLQMTSAGAEPAAMEKEVRRDPALAFRLFRYLNSPAFGLRVEIQSFQHALMMLGYKRLKKWLALLIATAAQDANLQPVMFASLRRGFFLEGLTREHADPNTRDEAFILGVFSLLDKLFSESFDRLFMQLQIPTSVHEALVEGTGPFMPYLKVAQAMELPAGPGIQDALDNALISLRDCNQTLIKALIESGQTQQPA